MLTTSGNSQYLTSNFVTSQTAFTTPALQFALTNPGVNVLDFACDGSYSQATGNALVSFAIGSSATVTNIFATGTQQISAGPPATYVSNTLPTQTSGTGTIVSGTPGATATNYTVHLAGQVENPSSTADTFSLYVSTASGSDAVTLLRGFSCHIFP
jgi:hypothetical protein